MTQEKKIVTDFITGTHLTQFKGYYEMDLVNEFNGLRYIFHIPRPLFDMMIFNKDKIKMVPMQRETPKEREVPVLTS
jgi:hypothetical protein